MTSRIESVRTTRCLGLGSSAKDESLAAVVCERGAAAAGGAIGQHTDEVLRECLDDWAGRLVPLRAHGIDRRPANRVAPL